MFPPLRDSDAWIDLVEEMTFVVGVVPLQDEVDGPEIAGEAVGCGRRTEWRRCDMVEGAADMDFEFQVQSRVVSRFGFVLGENVFLEAMFRYKYQGSVERRSGPVYIQFSPHVDQNSPPAPHSNCYRDGITEACRERR